MTSDHVTPAFASQSMTLPPHVRVAELQAELTKLNETYKATHAYAHRLLTAATGDPDYEFETTDEAVEFVKRLREDRGRLANGMTLTHGPIAAKSEETLIAECNQTLNSALDAARLTACLMKDDMLEWYQWWVKFLFRIPELYQINASRVQMVEALNRLTHLAVRR